MNENEKKAFLKEIKKSFLETWKIFQNQSKNF